MEYYNIKGNFFQEQKLKGVIFMCKNQLKKENANKFSEHYRNEVMNEQVLEKLPKEDFNNLIDVAKYAKLGIMTAIETAFCLGYETGKGGAGNE